MTNISANRFFCGALDDVYQSDKYATAMGAPSIITKEDLKIHMGLALIFGQILVSPLRFLMDHRPFVNLCKDSKWRNLIFTSNLVLPAAKETDLDEFLQFCTGTPKTPPLKMSSYEIGNRPVEEAWNSGKDPGASSEAFAREFPHAITFIENLKSLDIKPVKFHKTDLRYSRFLAARLHELPLRKEVIDYFSEVNFRGDVLQMIEDLSGQLTTDEAQCLTRTAISAKHDEVAETLEVRGVTKPTNYPLPAKEQAFSQTALSNLGAAINLPAIGGILNASYGAEALASLTEDKKFPDLRTDFVRARLSQVASERDVAESFQRLCHRTASVLGIRRSEHRAKAWVATGAASGGLSALFQLNLTQPNDIFALFLGAGCILLIAGSMTPHIPETWSYLSYDRKLHTELLKVGRGQY